MILSSYSFIKKIGQGSFGEVWLVENEVKKKCVLKKITITYANEKQKTAARSECELLKKLIHPNIVQYHDSFEENGSLYIAMSYCEGGDLYSKLKHQNGKKLSEKQIIEWFMQIVMALLFIHDQKILHRDLKTQNIFLAKYSIIKVGDLGIAKQLQNKNDLASTMIGTPYYMSPELLNNEKYNYKSDIWSLGCVTYEMATLKHAFSANDYEALSLKIIKGHIPPMPSIYSKELVALIKAMLSNKPDDRPSTKRILQTPFIQQHIQDYLDNIKGGKYSSPSGQLIIHRVKAGSPEGKSQSIGSSPFTNSPKRLSENKSAPSSSDSLQIKHNEGGDDNENSNNPSMIDNQRRPSKTVLEKEMDKINIVMEMKYPSPREHSLVPIEHSTDLSLISRKGYKNERQSARDRRRERNRNNGLNTMFFPCDDELICDHKSDESEIVDTNRLSARYRRRTSSENEQIVILPQLRRQSGDEVFSSIDEDARGDLIKMFENMKLMLKVCRKEQYVVAQRSSTPCNAVVFDSEENCNDIPGSGKLHNKDYSVIRKYVHVS